MNKRFYLPILFALAVILGVVLGASLSNQIPPERLRKLDEILSLVDKKYVDHVSWDTLLPQAINQMLHSMDPHSSYLTKVEAQREGELIQGSFGGVGIRFQIIRDTVCVIQATREGPSYRAGIRDGDRILMVNAKAFTGPSITNDKVLSALKGKEGTAVSLTVQRGSKKVTFTITRDQIPLHSVPVGYMVNASIGYIKIEQFSLKTHEEFQLMAMKLLSQGMKGLILDLRGNPGGIMNDAIKVADEFLPVGETIVSTKGKRINKTVKATKEIGMLENIKLVVLMDENSASASEIVAGAIQDNDRGTLLGRRTFGKGLVQEEQRLSDGSTLRLTIARYYTPSGRCIQKAFNGNMTDYTNEHEARLKRGELYYKDSMFIDKTLKHKTKNGRTVYGGGGVIPDLFIPLEKMNPSALMTRLYFSEAISAFVFDDLQRNRSQWKSVNDLISYSIGEKEITRLLAYVNTVYGISSTAEEKQASFSDLKRRLKEEYARQLWERDGVYKVQNKESTEIKEALKILLR
jgi:carboxyl-terminal processing protease